MAAKYIFVALTSAVLLGGCEVSKDVREMKDAQRAEIIPNIISINDRVEVLNSEVSALADNVEKGFSEVDTQFKNLKATSNRLSFQINRILGELTIVAANRNAQYAALLRQHLEATNKSIASLRLQIASANDTERVQLQKRLDEQTATNEEIQKQLVEMPKKIDEMLKSVKKLEKQGVMEKGTVAIIQYMVKMTSNGPNATLAGNVGTLNVNPPVD